MAGAASPARSTLMATLYSLIKSPSHTFFSSPHERASRPAFVPPIIYRVHYRSSQTRYHIVKGFEAKNHTTIVNYTSGLSRFGLAHLHHQTNIASPFISMYDDLEHAEKVARYFSQKYGEDTLIVAVDTRYLGRGPIFRAADILKHDGEEEKRKRRDDHADFLHLGEYLVMYRIPAQAIQSEVTVAKACDQQWRSVGIIGKR